MKCNPIIAALLDGVEVVIAGETYKLFYKNEPIPYLEDDGTMNFEDWAAAHTAIYKKCPVTYFSKPLGDKWLSWVSELGQLIELAGMATDEERTICSANIVLNEVIQVRR